MNWEYINTVDLLYIRPQLSAQIKDSGILLKKKVHQTRSWFQYTENKRKFEFLELKSSSHFSTHEQ